MWPKTEKEGKWDREERVEDWRTVKRFLERGEEKEVKRGRKGLVEMRARRESASLTPATSLSRGVTESVEVESPRKRGGGRGRQTI